MIIIFPSGSYLCLNKVCGYQFWGVHNHDSIWHLAVASVSFRSYPLLAPTFAGGFLTGYNMLLDLITYLLSFIGIPFTVSFFKILPIIWFIAFTSITITFARKLYDSALFVGLLLFFFFFGSSFSYFFTLYHDRSFERSASILSMQAGNMLSNFQLAISFCFLLLLLIFIHDKKFSLKNAVQIGLLVFLTIGFKFYGGIMAIFLSGCYLLEYLIIKKDWPGFMKRAAIIGLFILLSVLIFYNPFLAFKSGSALIFAPFALVHSMIEEPTLFYLPDMVNARYFLYSTGNFSSRLVFIELFSVFLFVFFNLGSRFFGFIILIIHKVKKQFRRLHLYIFLTIVLATVIPVLFIQKGQWWNTVQFFYYAQFLAGIFIAELLYKMFKTKRITLIIPALLLLIMTIPYNIDVIKPYIDSKPAVISSEEVEALGYLKKQPFGVVFHSFDDKNGKKSYIEVAYIAAFSGKQSYVSDFVQLDLIGIDYADRLKKLEKYDCSVMKDSDYIYYREDFSVTLLEKCSSYLKSNFTQSFKNNKVTIYSKIK